MSIYFMNSDGLSQLSSLIYNDFKNVNNSIKNCMNEVYTLKNDLNNLSSGNKDELSNPVSELICYSKRYNYRNMESYVNNIFYITPTYNSYYTTNLYTIEVNRQDSSNQYINFTLGYDIRGTSNRSFYEKHDFSSSDMYNKDLFDLNDDYSIFLSYNYIYTINKKGIDNISKKCLYVTQDKTTYKYINEDINIGNFIVQGRASKISSDYTGHHHYVIDNSRFFTQYYDISHGASKPSIISTSYVKLRDYSDYSKASDVYARDSDIFKYHILGIFEKNNKKYISLCEFISSSFSYLYLRLHFYSYDNDFVNLDEVFYKDINISFDTKYTYNLFDDMKFVKIEEDKAILIRCIKRNCVKLDDTSTYYTIFHCDAVLLNIDIDNNNVDIIDNINVYTTIFDIGIYANLNVILMPTFSINKDNIVLSLKSDRSDGGVSGDIFTSYCFKVYDNKIVLKKFDGVCLNSETVVNGCYQYVHRGYYDNSERFISEIRKIKF